MVIVGTIIQFIGLTRDFVVYADFRTAERAVLPFSELQAPGEAVIVKVHAGGQVMHIAERRNGVIVFYVVARPLPRIEFRIEHVFFRVIVVAERVNQRTDQSNGLAAVCRDIRKRLL